MGRGRGQVRALMIAHSETRSLGRSSALTASRVSLKVKKVRAACWCGAGLGGGKDGVDGWVQRCRRQAWGPATPPYTHTVWAAGTKAAPHRGALKDLLRSLFSVYPWQPLRP